MGSDKMVLIQMLTLRRSNSTSIHRSILHRLATIHNAGDRQIDPLEMGSLCSNIGGLKRIQIAQLPPKTVIVERNLTDTVYFAPWRHNNLDSISTKCCQQERVNSLHVTHETCIGNRLIVS